MRKLGALLLWAGVAVGALVGLGLLAGIKIGEQPWIVSVGLVKLTLLAAGGLIAAGATLQRLARREDKRKRVSNAAGAERLR